MRRKEGAKQRESLPKSHLLQRQSKVSRVSRPEIEQPGQIIEVVLRTAEIHRIVVSSLYLSKESIVFLGLLI